MRMDDAVSSMNWRSFGYGAAAGSGTVGICGLCWKIFRKKKKPEDEEADVEQDEGSLPREEGGKVVLFEEMAKLRSRIPVEHQDMMLMRFSDIHVFMQSDISDEIRMKIAQELFNLVKSYNAFCQCLDEGKSTDMEVSAEDYIRATGDNMLALISESGASKKITNLADSSVEWIVDYLATPQQKVANQ